MKSRISCTASIAGFLDCGGKQSATPLSLEAAFAPPNAGASRPAKPQTCDSGTVSLLWVSMILEPHSLDGLSRELAAAHAARQKISAVRLGALSRLVEHTPEDMTATVEGGMILRAFQEQLAERGQWLPMDPPQPDSLTIEELLAADASGPRRFGYGTVRDYLIGIRVVLPDGRIIKAGGNVVKNVAGYDLCKLFIGSRGTLGVIVEATFKLRPLPEAERFVEAEFDSLSGADQFLESVRGSALNPVVLDLHHLAALHGPSSGTYTVVLGFAGAREDVDFQSGQAAELGARVPSGLDYEREFWRHGSPGKARRVSVLPSEIANTVRGLGGVPFVARAGNGVIWYRGGPDPVQTELPLALLRRVKDGFDPNRILPDLLL